MSNLPEKSHYENAYHEQKAPWDIPGPQPAFAAAAERIAGTLLDAGCGTGEHALFLAARGNDVTAFDYLETPIQRARQKAQQRGLSIDFRVQDATALADLDPWRHKFDAAIDSGLLHCLSDDDRQRYVAGLASVLKPGGRLFLMCFSDAEPGTVGPRRISKADLHAAFAAGWTIESIEPSRFQITPAFADQFSADGPRAWFAVVRHD